MAELVDALDSGSSELTLIGVQFPSLTPTGKQIQSQTDSYPLETLIKAHCTKDCTKGYFMRAFSLSKPPSNLLYLETGFYFRLVVPKDLRPQLQKREIRIFLGASKKQEAQRKAGVFSAIIWNMFDAVRRGDKRVDKLTVDKIKEIVRKHVEDRLLEDEIDRATRPTLPGAITIDDYIGSREQYEDEQDPSDANMECLEDWVSSCRLALRKNNYTHVKEDALEVGRKNGISTKEEDEEFKFLSRELLKAEIIITNQKIKRIYDEFRGEYTALEAPEGVMPEAKPKANPDESPKLSKAVELFIEEKADEKQVRASTKEQNRMRLNQLVAWTNDPAITDITQDMLRDLMKILAFYPKNKEKSKKYRTWNLERIRKHQADIPEEDRLSIKTRRDYISLYNYFLGWLKTNYIVPIWLDAILKAPKDTSSPDTKRAMFSQEDLINIFSLPEYVAEDEKPYKFWLPLLALFTGARREELLQLHLSDFKIKDDTKCFKITDLEDEEGGSAGVKHVKNKASRRIVPIHDELLNLGLWRYVEELRDKGCKRLFEELKPSGLDNKYGNSLSQDWYSKVLAKAGVKGDKVNGDKTFHSYRHTFISHCAHKLIYAPYVYRITGHGGDKSDVHTGVYTKGFPANDLKREVMDKVNFDVDLSHLKQNKFAR